MSSRRSSRSAAARPCTCCSRYAAGAISPSLTALRLVSVTFAVASMPVIAALVARLTDKRTALVATALAAASWITIYHGIYARMYSLFLFLSALSFLPLLRAIGTSDRRRWAAWIAATLAHDRDTAVRNLRARGPGGLRARAEAAAPASTSSCRDLVRRRRRPRGAALAHLPCTRLAVRHRGDRRERLELGLSGRRPRVRLENDRRLRRRLGPRRRPSSSALAVLGAVVLVRTRPAAVLLSGAVLVVPTLALTLTRSAVERLPGKPASRSSRSPSSRCSSPPAS